jgi:hypothetical protein
LPHPCLTSSGLMILGDQRKKGWAEEGSSEMLRQRHTTRLLPASGNAHHFQGVAPVAEVDHSTINRWVIKCSPQLEEAFHRRKRLVWVKHREGNVLKNQAYGERLRASPLNPMESGCHPPRKKTVANRGQPWHYIRLWSIASPLPSSSPGRSFIAVVAFSQPCGHPRLLVSPSRATLHLLGKQP